MKTQWVGLDSSLDPLYMGSMSEPRTPELEERRTQLLERLSALPNLMRGTVYEKPRKCGRASCHCATGGPKHTTLQLTVFLRGKTRTRYVRRGERSQVEVLVGPRPACC